ncbi:hypothetical protein [Kutzneria buriramensis]|uniref:Uncharacterized protein n=1 Tax=Kutzneria buriramensis TaxID=1045776 RepID=A0A3E0GW81_9PSEU|nr:hypothetical protein [Kutzneria buriramensis]REH28567.1 hypothetical protein BCF44_1269 [Kutzneria buriramensis]
MTVVSDEIKAHQVRCRDAAGRQRSSSVVRLPDGRVGIGVPAGEWAEPEPGDAAAFAMAVGSAGIGAVPFAMAASGNSSVTRLRKPA